jgi:hypothetical protein
MLTYTKTILHKVSFDKDLFKRELKKSLKWLQKDEIIALQSWCAINFGVVYSDVISEVFKSYF